MYNMITGFLILVLFMIKSQAGATAPVELRGVWLTNVDSEILDSRESIAEAMQFLADHNFNVVLPVVWNDAKTLYYSQTMDSLFDMPIDPCYAGRDPLAEVIAEAHARDLAVIAWFEYGFSSSFEKDGGMILSKKPAWAARDRIGGLLTKNGFEWMNAYHPDVQKFIFKLVSEVVANYDVDGVQGDDRLPAQPIEGGYSNYTRNLYFSETGKYPPQNERDPTWQEWRAKKLNTFVAGLYRQVKTVKPRVLVTWAPSIFDWSLHEYLQDWPSWLRSGNADLLIPQNYRYSFYEYMQTVNDLNAQYLGIPDNLLSKIYPGILINVGDYCISEDFLSRCIEYNRTMGFNGEVFFFYEGLRKNDDALAKMLRSKYYRRKVKRPF